LELSKVRARPIHASEAKQFQLLMQEHHYLGALPKISETIRYACIYREKWVALLSFSASALKCSDRDRWIGWSQRHQYDRLKLITNNSRFLILPDHHAPNLGSRVLSLCQKRISNDWQENFGHPLLLLETFVNPQYFYGTVYKAANWICLGHTKGYRRKRKGYGTSTETPKIIFVKPLKSNAKFLLSQPVIPACYQTKGTKLMLTADQMQSLPDFFSDIDDPRREQGRRHRLSTVLSIAAGAVLCGMRGYRAIFDWAKNLKQNARRRFRCRFENGKYIIPSEYVIRNVLIRVEPAQLDSALQKWNRVHAQEDESLAIDGKTMCNAIDENGCQTHILSAVGHQSKVCHTQKKSAPCP
jgi:hypothetical protein